MAFVRPTLIAAALLVFGVPPLWPTQYALTSDDKQVVSAWLAKHPGFRMARDTDCACDEDLQTLRTVGYGGRWKPVPDYHPYAVVGDFNGDGESDFAVAVIRTDPSHKFTILVFDGPLKPEKNPSFIDSDSNMVDVGFFYGPPRPTPYRLVVSAFGSEGYVLVPKGQTYHLEPISKAGE